MIDNDPDKISSPGSNESQSAADQAPPKSKSKAEAVCETGAAESTPAKELTPEEQMALYEESLKESDWGHQPC